MDLQLYNFLSKACSSIIYVQFVLWKAYLNLPMNFQMNISIKFYSTDHRLELSTSFWFQSDHFCISPLTGGGFTKDGEAICLRMRRNWCRQNKSVWRQQRLAGPTDIEQNPLWLPTTNFLRPQEKSHDKKITNEKCPRYKIVIILSLKNHWAKSSLIFFSQATIIFIVWTGWRPKGYSRKK